MVGYNVNVDFSFYGGKDSFNWIATIELDERSLSYLNDSITNYKRVAVDVVGSYQKSNMGTLKWHMLDHVSNDLRRIRILQYLNAGLFEYANATYKKYEKMK